MESKMKTEKPAVERARYAGEPLASPSPVGWRCQECAQSRSSSDMLRGDGLCERCRAKL